MKASDSAIRLVVNADGFGLDAAITRGTLRAHREGIVTSTSVIGNCADPDAIRLELASAPALGVGVHLTLTGGAPIARPSAIRSLLGPDERFPSQAREVFLSWAKAEPRGDEIELGAVQRLVGNAAGRISMSSTKSCIGHLLGAAGAVEAIFSILAIRDQIAPPTINLDNPSVETPIDLVPHVARKRDIDTALSNSFGFGGTNASLIFSRYSD